MGDIHSGFFFRGGGVWGIGIYVLQATLHHIHPFSPQNLQSPSPKPLRPDFTFPDAKISFGSAASLIPSQSVLQIYRQGQHLETADAFGTPHGPPWLRQRSFRAYARLLAPDPPCQGGCSQCWATRNLPRREGVKSQSVMRLGD